MEPSMKPFTLDRTDERNTEGVGGILLYAALFFIVTRIAAMLLQKSGATLYEWGWGLDAAGMFGARTPESMVSEMGWRAVPHVLLLAPFVEECAFRLGLSFRRWHVAAGLGALAYFFADWMLFFADVANARTGHCRSGLPLQRRFTGLRRTGSGCGNGTGGCARRCGLRQWFLPLYTCFPLRRLPGACCPMRYCMCWGSFSPGASLSICA